MNKIEKYAQVVAVGLVALIIVGASICGVVSLIQPIEVVQQLFTYLVMVPMGLLLVISILALLYLLNELIIYLINEEE